MLGSMATVPLPAYDFDALPTPDGGWNKPLQGLLFERSRIEVPVINWRGASHRSVRISAQAYNSIEDYDNLATAVIEAMKG